MPKASGMQWNRNTSFLFKSPIPDAISWIKKYIDYVDNNGCWIPKNKPDKNGYVRIVLSKDRIVLSRLAVSIYTHSDYNDKSWEANHECNNPLCFNPYPKHVYKGTVSSNMIDAVNIGTHKETRKLHCKNGHLYDIKDAYFDTSRGIIRSSRRCSICTATNRKVIRNRGRNA